MVLPALPVELVERVRVLAGEQDLIPDRSGESKRHQVYARLIKDFPTLPKRMLALAIEMGR